jgi:hypothetical protein
MAFAAEPYPTGMLYVIVGDTLYSVSPLSPYTRTRLGNPTWANATSMTTDVRKGHPLYIISGGILSSVSPITGKASRLPGRAGASGTWNGDTRMTTALAGTSATGGVGDLIITQAGHLWRVTPSTGDLFDLGGDWSNTTSIGNTSNFYSYAIQSSQFLVINPRTGTWQSLGSGWGGPTQMATTADTSGPFVIQANFLLRVNASTGQYFYITSAIWNGATSMTELPAETDGGVSPPFLYIMKGNQLWEVTSDGSNMVTLATFGANFSGPTQMVAQF